jgi:hypothetical protein
MPRPCSICLHPECPAIEQALAAKAPYRTIAERFGTSPAALSRHQHTHVQAHADVVPQGALTSEAGPFPVPPAWRALAVDAAALHEQALQARTLVQFVEALRAVTGLLVAIITAPRD